MLKELCAYSLRVTYMSRLLFLDLLNNIYCLSHKALDTTALIAYNEKENVAHNTKNKYISQR